jgi:S-formylglutathione hydrolase FrmB
MRASDDRVGPPWQRPLQGRLDQLVIESQVLRDNPLGDPHIRPIHVYVPPAVLDRGGPVPSVYVLPGFGGRVDIWGNHKPFEPTVLDRVDAQFATPGTAPAIVVVVDAWTRYGGSQYLNSAGTGRYLDFLCDEVVPFVDAAYPTMADRSGRAVTGKSSGGYGAMVVSMLRPDCFGAFATHAGDALFECCYLPKFPLIARLLRDHFDGDYDTFHRIREQAPIFEADKFGRPLEFYAYASCYSPGPDGRPELPFDLATGQLVEDVWRRWLAWDPVRMVPTYREALASMRTILIDAGRSDEHYLDLGALAFSQALTTVDIPHSFELFEGTHFTFDHRYAPTLARLAGDLAG